MSLIEVMGWVGSTLFAACAFPQAVKTYKDGHAEGLSWLFLLMWFFGEILTAAYVMLTSMSIPLLANYGANFILLVIILKYKIWPR